MSAVDGEPPFALRMHRKHAPSQCGSAPSNVLPTSRRQSHALFCRQVAGSTPRFMERELTLKQRAQLDDALGLYFSRPGTDCD